MRFPVLFLCLAASLSACAPGKPSRGGGFPSGPIGVNQPSALLAQARDMNAREGCARAAPVYRIVSSHGEGHEVAQYELGACLLEMTGASDAETTLFRQEALFWLERAAWAGNPRAQGKLAELLSGAPAYGATFVPADAQEAMMWSIVYAANGVRDVYGLRDLPPLVRDHLSASISPQALAAAQREANAYVKISMSEFVPTARGDENQRGRASDERQGSPEGGRRRRPQ